MRTNPLKLPKALASKGSDLEIHLLDIPSCCPVSKNPRPGSVIAIIYRPQANVLEVGALAAYIHQYKGGLKDEHGAIVVRDMEGMVSRIAQDCANAAQTTVAVLAYLHIVPRQRMFLMTEKIPERVEREALA